MGLRFKLQVLRGNVKRFFHNERTALTDNTCRWEPGINIRLEGDSLIIEPQDQRKASTYPQYVKEVLGRAYEQLRSFSFGRERYHPNPPLHELFFANVLLPDAIKRAELEYGFRMPSEHWQRREFEKQFERLPLSDTTLRSMFLSGLKIDYWKNNSTEEGGCFPPQKSCLPMWVGCKGPKKEQDETLVHETVEAYGFWVGCNGDLSDDTKFKKSVFRDGSSDHGLVVALHKELYEFGFHRTIRRFAKEYDAIQ